MMTHAGRWVLDNMLDFRKEHLADKDEEDGKQYVASAKRYNADEKKDGTTSEGTAAGTCLSRALRSNMVRTPEIVEKNRDCSNSLNNGRKDKRSPANTRHSLSASSVCCKDETTRTSRTTTFKL